MKTVVISALQNIFCICSKPLHSTFLAKQVIPRLLWAWGEFSPPQTLPGQGCPFLLTHRDKTEEPRSRWERVKKL